MKNGERLVYLVRHGLDDAAGGDGGLTAEGRRQAALTARALRDAPVSVIRTSTLRRARETAAIIAELFPAVAVEEQEDLCECVPLVPAATAYLVPPADGGDPIERFRTDETYRCDVGSSFLASMRVTPADVEEHRARAERAFALLFGRRQAGERSGEHIYARCERVAHGEGTHEVVVCHGNLIRYLVARVLGADPLVWGAMLTSNGGITRVFAGAAGELILLSFNETGHLPPELQTG
jgi:broad specificity phosphatase PhoE